MSNNNNDDDDDDDALHHNTEHAPANNASRGARFFIRNPSTTVALRPMAQRPLRGHAALQAGADSAKMATAANQEAPARSRQQPRGEDFDLTRSRLLCGPSGMASCDGGADIAAQPGKEEAYAGQPHGQLTSDMTTNEHAG